MKNLLLTIITLSSLITSAQNLFKEDFSTYTTGVQLSGQGTWTNNSSNGGLGACAGAICDNAKVLSQSVSYFNFGSSPNAFQLLTGTDGCGRTFTPVTSGDMYLGFTINISNASSSPNDCLRVLSGSSLTTTFRLYIKAAGGNTFNVGMSKGSSGATSYATGAYGYNQDHLIIFKYSIAAGTNDDVLNVYVDPTYASGEPSIPTLSTTNGADQSTSIDRVAFRQGTTNTPNGWVGLTSVARTWADLTFNLSNDQFNKNTFTIASNEVSKGIINIKSSIAIEKAILNIYDIQGKTIATKNITLEETINEILVNPITNSGVYIVEIVSENNQHFSQKIVVN